MATLRQLKRGPRYVFPARDRWVEQPEDPLMHRADAYAGKTFTVIEDAAGRGRRIRAEDDGVELLLSSGMFTRGTTFEEYNDARSRALAETSGLPPDVSAHIVKKYAGKSKKRRRSSKRKSTRRRR